MGHKTTGDWDDVTSFGRNEIVFEGRNKAYGAFYVRQRYNFALFLGFLLSMSILVVGSSAPMLVEKFCKNTVPFVNPAPVDSITITIIDLKPPKPRPRVDPPKRLTNTKQPQTRNTPPVVVLDPEHKDSEKTQKQLNNSNTGTTDIPGDQNAEPPLPPVDPGPPTPPAPPAPLLYAPVMPQFPGDLTNYISNNVDYPAAMRDLGVQGTVWATFVVETDGTISEIKILKGVPGGEQLNSSTIDVLAKMPKWSPGLQNGHPVRVRLNLPVKFILK
ncbi:MAG: energy transducer TonB [Bacteroidia bacterium]